jgi:hypothetical protein
MEQLLDRLMQGIDPDDPHAAMILFWRMMGLIDWWQLFWLTVACAVVGGLIGWPKREFWKGVALGAALGPIGWVISLVSRGARPCPACRRAVGPRDNHCRHCGAALSSGPGRAGK